MAEESVDASAQDNTGSDDTGGAWNDGLAEEYKNNELFSGHDSIDSLAKTHIELNNKLSEVEGSIPKVPESPDKYEFDEMEDVDEELIGNFRAFAHKHKLTNEQAKEAVNFHNSAMKEMAEKFFADRDRKENEGITSLKKEWGANFDKNTELAKRVVRTIGGDDVKAAMDETRAGNSAVIIKFLHNIATKMSEDSLVVGNNSTPPPGPKKDAFGRPILRFPSMEK